MTNPRPTRKGNAASKTRHPGPGRTKQAQNKNLSIEEETTNHPAESQPATSPADDETSTTNAELPRKPRGRPKKTTVNDQTNAEAESALAEAAPRKRGRKPATPVDELIAQPPAKRAKAGEAVII